MLPFPATRIIKVCREILMLSGSVTEWFYKYPGGISPDLENPGFGKFYLATARPWGLEYVNSGYQSPFGTIVSNWKKEGPDSYMYEMEILPESTAIVRLQVNGPQKINIVKQPDNQFDPELITGIQSVHFELNEGNRITTCK